MCHGVYMHPPEGVRAERARKDTVKPKQQAALLAPLMELFDNTDSFGKQSQSNGQTTLFMSFSA